MYAHRIDVDNHARYKGWLEDMDHDRPRLRAFQGLAVEAPAGVRESRGSVASSYLVGKVASDVSQVEGLIDIMMS